MNLNEYSTTQHSDGRHWSAIVKIRRDNAVQDITLVSMVHAPLPSKRGKEGGPFVGEFVVVHDATRIRNQLNVSTFCLLVLDNRDLGHSAWYRERCLEQLQIVLCIESVKAFY